jgi:methionyl-tRNA formyltransferase
MNKTVFIGSVLSSKIALETIIGCGVNVDLVCSLDEGSSDNVSDYYPIHEIAMKNGIPFIKFSKIGSEEAIGRIRDADPDFIFVIGISQIIPEEILKTARKYSIGFHPTPLPVHRGRAAIPWQIILGVRNSKISLFKLDEGMDTGDIIIQYPYEIEPDDYAMDVYMKECGSMREALKECIPRIYSDTVEFQKQEHRLATYLLARRPEDGKLDWHLPGKELFNLIRATSRPYPGAFAYYNDVKVIFWKARLEENLKFTGIPGQIAWINEEGEVAVVTKDSMLIISEYEIMGDRKSFVIGHKFK